MQSDYLIVEKMSQNISESIDYYIDDLFEYIVKIDDSIHRGADGFNSHYFDKELNIAWGMIYAIVKNFISVKNYKEFGEKFDFESFWIQLIVIFLCERICVELSLLNDIIIENPCKPCICLEIACEMLEVEFVED